VITRFAPSPTGPLHLGHAFSALTVWETAQRLGGTALLRIEDFDSTRTRPEHIDAIYTDLTWLGLTWPDPVRIQSEHFSDYWSTLNRLEAMGLLYPCSLNRREILAAGAQPGVDGLVYPGVGRHSSMEDAKPGDAIRLNLQKALALVDSPITYQELEHGQQEISHDWLLSQIGDPVLRRKDTGDPAYHLACCHDDAQQGVTHVVRGKDIEAQTSLHVVLQKLLGWPTPTYHHHGLITDESGKRLAKIDKSKALSKYRAEGATPNDIRRLVGLA